MMRRLPGWEPLLDGYLRGRRLAPFAWGVNDCALFACDGVLAITGVDVGAGLRGTYTDALGAMRTLRRYAGGDVLALAQKIARRYGIAEIAPLYATAGDVVALEVAGTGRGLGLVNLNGWELALPQPGAFHATLRDATHAWRIG